MAAITRLVTGCSAFKDGSPTECRIVVASSVVIARRSAEVFALRPQPRIPNPESLIPVLRAAAGVAAVDALVAGAAADHDRAAGRARRRVFLVLNGRERLRRGGRRRLGGRGG